MNRQAALEDVGWEIIDNKLTKQFNFKDFNKAMTFVNKVSEVSEQNNHHPDIYISYNKVTFKLWTHTTGEISEKDFNLALNIEEIS